MTLILTENNKMEAFAKDGVVPDVIDAAPAKLLQLKYDDLDIQLGMVTTPTLVQNPPTVTYDAEPGAFYTLVMNDPDAPSRKDPKFGEWHHWLVVNIPGGDVAKGETMSEYVGAGPPKDTGLHRYVFLLYKQPGMMEFAGLDKLTNRSGNGRPKQKVRQFIKKYGLEGSLVAGNFFQAEWDDYVPKLYEQLSG